MTNSDSVPSAATRCAAPDMYDDACETILAPEECHSSNPQIRSSVCYRWDNIYPFSDTSCISSLIYRIASGIRNCSSNYPSANSVQVHYLTTVSQTTTILVDQRLKQSHQNLTQKLISEAHKLPEKHWIHLKII
jgi:hypothetical protein